MRFSLLLVAVALPCCGDDATTPGDPPEGLDCDSAVDGGEDGASLTAALANARSGDCVVLGSFEYVGVFLVPGGVTVTAGKGETPTLTSSERGAAVELISDEGGTLNDLTFEGNGIAIVAGAGVVRNVNVTGGLFGIAVNCDSDTCTGDAREAIIEGAQLAQNDSGIIVQGAAARLSDIEISDSHGTTVVDGHGLVVSQNAQLTAERLSITGSATAAVVVDGAGTIATLTEAVIDNNEDRGVVGQFLDGSTGVPALRIVDSDIRANAGAGLSMIRSSGIVVLDSSISDTRNKPIVTITGTADIGDGVQLLDASGQVSMENVTLADNERCQMIVDDGSGNISFTGSASGGAYLIVVQNTTSDVDVPAEYLEDSAPELPVP